MKQKTSAKKSPLYVEVIFDLLYLLSALIFGLYFVFSDTGFGVRTLWGILSLVLAFGDAFHLFPRIAASLSQDASRFFVAKGRGKQITSLTMTVFYLLLWHAGLLLLNERSDWTVLIYFFAVVRVVLCLLPQNAWTQQTPSQGFALLRNIPFLLQGALVFCLFANPTLLALAGFRFVPLAIFLSFAFYMPVVLFSQKKPMLGMLMLPKTLAYLFLVSRGFYL